MKDSSEPHFRAVNCNGVRRGLRLERAFWSALDDISRRRGISVGDYVDRVFHEDKTEIGLSGRVRAAVLGDLAGLVTEYEERLALNRALSIIQITPAPAFLLAEDKRILGYNNQFLELVQRRLTATSHSDLLKRVALTLDAPVSDMINELAQSDRKTLTTGFAFGASDKRTRGRLAIALAPIASPRAVMAYVVS
jgi:predicted DNA-binding ribbon-helix-helix protein